MKANLIENLIVSHCTGEESKFANAVSELIKDEEKKGNIPLAARLRKAYETKQKSKSEPSFNVSAAGFAPQSQAIAPRDKDSLLELYEIVHSDIKLADVILPETQKNALEQLIEEQKNAEALKKHNIEPANRLLLCGPPGCGKTMTAYAIGHALGLPIAYVRLDGLVSSYLGQTSTNLRKVFDSVRNQRIILFLDEFDAIAKKRDDSNELGELKRVVTTLLQNFDNMPANVLLIAATNHEHLLDPAIWRRFNLTITLELPDEAQRLILLQKWMNEYAISESQYKNRGGNNMSYQYTTLLVEQQEKGIMVVTLNRPEKLNAMNMAMLEELNDLWLKLKRDRETRVVILKGAGEKGFCGGMEVPDVITPEKMKDIPAMYDLQIPIGELQINMRKIPQPIICIVHGSAAGAGFSFVIASDIRIISPDARFSAAYVNVGLAGADMGSSYFLPRMIGTGRAYEFLYTGNWMNAEEAMSLGFASRCVPREELMSQALDLAQIIAKKDPLAMWLTKEALNQNIDCAGLEQAIIMENRNQNMMISHLVNKSK
jgi:enoyl-CoA hydratase/carnithine racemase/predicted AAA+ superfamily ATPase